MALGFNSFNMMNTNINCGLSNMYGSNMLGFGNILGNFGLGGSVFGMGYGSSPFMDCNGYTNYNAMAGYSIGNTLINFAGLALNSCLGSGSSQAQAASDLNTDLDSCLEDIEEKLDKLEGDYNSNTVTTSDLDKAKTSDLKAAEEKLNEFSEDKKPKKEDDKYKKTTTTTDDKGNTTITTSIDTTNYDKDLENWNNNKAKAQKAKDDAQEAQEKLVDELKELIKERDEIKREINETILDNADGSKPKHRNTGLDLNKFNLPEGSTDKITNVTREDIAQLIYLFRNAGTDNDKRTYQKAIQNIKDSAFLGVASNDQAKARKIILDWSAENSNI